MAEEEGNARLWGEVGNALSWEVEGNAWLDGGIHDSMDSHHYWRGDIHAQEANHKHRPQSYIGRRKGILHRLELDNDDDDGKEART